MSINYSNNVPKVIVNYSRNNTIKQLDPRYIDTVSGDYQQKFKQAGGIISKTRLFPQVNGYSVDSYHQDQITATNKENYRISQPKIQQSLDFGQPIPNSFINNQKIIDQYALETQQSGYDNVHKDSESNVHFGFNSEKRSAYGHTKNKMTSEITKNTIESQVTTTPFIDYSVDPGNETRSTLMKDYKDKANLPPPSYRTGPGSETGSTSSTIKNAGIGIISTGPTIYKRPFNDSVLHQELTDDVGRLSRHEIHWKQPPYNIFDNTKKVPEYTALLKRYSNNNISNPDLERLKDLQSELYAKRIRNM
jgi:hypothetical protein